MKYLKINDKEFSGDLLPGMITPTVEIIKTEERSVSGKMNVDITARKIKLQIAWSVVSNDLIHFITDIAQSSEPLIVEYFDAMTNIKAVKTVQTTGSRKSIDAYAGAVTYTPLFLGDKMLWRDVSLELIEI